MGIIVDPNNYENVVSKMLCLLEDKKKRNGEKFFGFDQKNKCK